MTTLKYATPKAGDCRLEVFASEVEVARKFETLCLVEGYTSTFIFADRSLSAAIEKARPKLCECGADAAILVSGSSDVSHGRGFATLKGIHFLEATATTDVK